MVTIKNKATRRNKKITDVEEGREIGFLVVLERL
jgi:hypothetical protein